LFFPAVARSSRQGWRELIPARAALSKNENEANSSGRGTMIMTECEVCKNEYDKSLEIVVNGVSHYFDCFECAIHALAPECEHCGCKIIGHGVEAAGTMFCCANCAHEEGVKALQDRA
jgi:hypothetical protein